VAVAALFDLDGTLIARNSAPLYMKHLRQTGQARRRDMARTLYFLAQYKLGLLDIERAMMVSLAWIRGRVEAEVREDCLHWYGRMIRPHLLPAMAATVDAHRRAGHVVAILTSATRYLAAPLAADLGIEHILVTQLVVRDGRFTGEAVLPVCYGDGKTYWAERFAAARAELLLHRLDHGPARPRAGGGAARGESRPATPPARRPPGLAGVAAGTAGDAARAARTRVDRGLRGGEGWRIEGRRDGRRRRGHSSARCSCCSGAHSPACCSCAT